MVNKDFHNATLSTCRKCWDRTHEQLFSYLLIDLGHTQVGRHLNIMGLKQDPLCSYCSVAEESASHCLCRCDYFATLRMWIWGKLDLYPADIDTATVGDIARFIKTSRRFQLSIQPWLEPQWMADGPASWSTPTGRQIALPHLGTWNLELGTAYWSLLLDNYSMTVAAWLQW